MEEDLNITFYSRYYSLNILNKACRLIAISQPIYDKWSQIITAPMDVIYDGVPIENYYIAKKEKHDKINVLLYGRIVPGKGQIFYIDAAIKAVKNITVACDFYLAGIIEDQEYYDECCTAIRKSNLGHRIHYIGEILDIKDLLMRTDIVCICSKMEGFGRVTVEAMLGKCLVLGANTGATAEIINDGETGLLYKSDDIKDFTHKLTTVINHYETYANIISEGQKYALNNFTNENNASKIVGLYEELMKGLRHG